MGIVFYEVATLQHPYQVENKGDYIEGWKNAHFFQTLPDPRDYNPSLDTSFVQLTKKMTSKRPQDRYESWDVVIQRLESFDPNSEDKKKDVSVLLERSIKTHNEQEQLHLKSEAQEKRIEEHNNIVKYRFNEEIFTGANQIVETFNSASEFVKLSLIRREYPSRDMTLSKGQYSSFLIGRVDRDNRYVAIEAVALYDSQYEFDGSQIIAWGNALAPSGKGFNIFLVASDTDDLYGQWLTSEASHNPSVRMGPSGPEPFPFHLNSLMHAARSLITNYDPYISKRTGIFDASMLNPLIEELL